MRLDIEKSSVPLALLLILLFGLSFSINRRYAGFIVNYVYTRTVDSRTDIIAVFVAVLLFATANWSITCLLGRRKIQRYRYSAGIFYATHGFNLYTGYYYFLVYRSRRGSNILSLTGNFPSLLPCSGLNRYYGDS